MSKISCLHLSDIHIGKSKTKSVDDFYSTICRDLKDQNQKIDIVICTGDFFCGKVKNKIELISRIVVFFENLLERINKEKLYNKAPLGKEDFIFVPGNHDIDRDSKSSIFHYYDNLLEKFYDAKTKRKLYNDDYYYTTKIFEEEKIAFIGLNSCRISKSITPQDSDWINKLDFKSIPLKDKENEKVIKNFLIESKTNFDDYGEISTKQLLNAFDELKGKIDINSYRIIAFFHHHIYPFPEIYDRYGDSSMIRNFPNVINTLIDNNVKIILHGHKHTPVSRLITTNKYFENPEKSMYIFSTGTLENIDGQRAFEVLDIFSPNQMIEAEIFKYNYSGEELQKRDEICIPPKYNIKNKSIGEFKSKLRQKDLSLFEKYVNEIEDRDNVSTKYSISNIVSNLENTLLSFDGINQDLNREPDMIYKILSFVHYRVVALDSINNEVNNNYVLELIKNGLKDIIKDSFYLEEILNILESKKSRDFNSKTKSLIDNLKYSAYRKTTSYLSVVVLFTDLFLSISPYGEIYFKKEGLEHKINIKLGEGEFNTNIPSNSIKIIGEEDRRCAIISFKCKNPTAHKIGVLIVKDFEERITKIEEAFKELNLKLYYIRPKVEKDGYELDNYNFEAYIPTLLPLLTGDNLYSQKEVFIRELIQNSYDAIRLREKIDKTNFDKNIYIEIGSETRENGEKNRFVRIKDYGIGMDLYKIERYFTSIGRSFYTSDDFKEFQREKKIKYKAVSNFGIGFLSVFMVCKEVKVKTKSYFNNDGVEIHIPNYEGCFFINKINDGIVEKGTEITIYEKEKGLINTTNINKYIKENFIDFGLNIIINYPGKEKKVDAYSLKQNLPKFSLFVPFDDFKVKDLDISKIVDKSFINKYPYGCSVHFDSTPEKTILLNSGIKVSHKTNEIELPIESNPLVNVYYNFPSSDINLDVSRDKILNLKTKDYGLFFKNIKTKLSKQALKLISLIEKDYKKETLSFINHIALFGYFSNKENDLIDETYSLLVLKDGNKFKFATCKKKNIENNKNNKELLLGINIDASLFVPERFENYLTDKFNLSKNSAKDALKRIAHISPEPFYSYGFRNHSKISTKEDLQETLNEILVKSIDSTIIFEDTRRGISKKEYKEYLKLSKYTQLEFEEFQKYESIHEINSNINIEFIADERQRYYQHIKNLRIHEPNLNRLFQLFMSSHTIEEIGS